MNVCILASGSGSNAENIISHAKTLSNLNIVGLISDQEDAYALIRAEKLGVESICLPFLRSGNNTLSKDKEIHESSIFEWMSERDVDWVFLAGYMRILSPAFIQKFFCEKKGVPKILNIHPSLLPAFPGKDAYKQAFLSGVKMSGVTVHFVDSGVDTGPPLLQESFPRKETDGLEDFVERGLQVEYRMYREAMNIISRNAFELRYIPESEKYFVSIKDN